MDRERSDLVEKLVKLNRVAKVVKGGRRFSFSALVVVGDMKGSVGVGFGKANDVSEAIRKSLEKGKRRMIHVPLKKGTIPHAITGAYKSSRVYLRPAAPGAGIIAGGAVRAVMVACGATDVLSKSMGSRNAMNVVKAVMNGLESLMDARGVASGRGKTVDEMWG